MKYEIKTTVADAHKLTYRIAVFRDGALDSARIVSHSQVTDVRNDLCGRLSETGADSVTADAVPEIPALRVKPSPLAGMPIYFGRKPLL